MLLLKVRLLFSIGIINILRVIVYRTLLRFNIHSVQRLTPLHTSINNVFNLIETYSSTLRYDSKFDLFLSEDCKNLRIINGKPDWFYNIYTNKSFLDTQKDWFDIPDFNCNGDIKGIWEASRFDWVIKFSYLAKKYKSNYFLLKINDWVCDWYNKNKPYKGPNWKCGQEASIRVIHLIGALVALNQYRICSTEILKFIELHLKRIYLTLSYSKAQDNNHGTSEAVALYIGAELLKIYFPQNKEYYTWSTKGYRLLENRVDRLIFKDGGFSQYSVNYHRLMLDSISFAEVSRLKLNLKPFSKQFYEKMSAATDWLRTLIQSNGDVPNLGANDGAMLFSLPGVDYRDFRPSLCLAGAIFNKNTYGCNSILVDYFNFDVSSAICRVDTPKNIWSISKSLFLENSGLICFRVDSIFLLFKVPKFKFRPSQSDILHLDLWVRDVNILRDSGTYSYNSNLDDIRYFGGVKGHNTVCFDQRDQMPRFGRFLFGAWPKISLFEYSDNFVKCGYKDYKGCTHVREVNIKNDGKIIEVIDDVSKFQVSAAIYWHLPFIKYSLEENKLTTELFSLEIDSDVSFSLEVLCREESRYYYQKEKQNVFKITILENAKVSTVVRLGG